MLLFFLAEAFLRVQPYRTFGTAQEFWWIRNNKEHDYRKMYVVDPDFGFRPVLGNEFYNIYGTRVNNYSIDKKPGVMRLLFIGDSVTERGHIIDGLRTMYGDAGIEYWNAGVGSFDTVQEVNFYKKYNAAIQPDQVILTFHLNDFMGTPVAFFNKEGRLVVFGPYVPLTRVNRFLFKNSMVYRACLGIVLRENKEERKEMENAVKKNLAELRDILARDHIPLTVLISPTCLPYDQWDTNDKMRHRTIIAMLNNLGIRYFDLANVLPAAQKDGITLYENDIWHPSKELGVYCGRYLYREGLLEKKRVVTE